MTLCVASSAGTDISVGAFMALSGAVSVYLLGSGETYAIPRPAVNKIKVATIGWIFIFATKNPFHIPHNTDTTSPIRIAAIQGIAYVSPLPRR